MADTAVGRVVPSRPARNADFQDQACAAADAFVKSVAARDYKGIFAAFVPDARFRYLIPPGPGEVVGAAEVAAKYFHWFGDADLMTVESVFVRPLADRISVRYRFLLHKQEGWKVIEQQTYLDMDSELRITAVDLLCSGFRPIGGREAMTSSGTHHFEAGTLGCAD